MIKHKNFFYDTGKCLALSKKRKRQEYLIENNFMVTKDYSFANPAFALVACLYIMLPLSVICITVIMSIGVE